MTLTKYYVLFEVSYGLTVSFVGEFLSEDEAWQGLADWRKKTGNDSIYFLNEGELRGFLGSIQNCLK